MLYYSHCFKTVHKVLAKKDLLNTCNEYILVGLKRNIETETGQQAIAVSFSFVCNSGKGANALCKGTQLRHCSSNCRIQTRTDAQLSGQKLFQESKLNAISNFVICIFL